jgi:protein-S-isoprenylcysteine O-methyltransferase Ste14
MYLGAMFLFLAMAFFLPHWIMATLSVVNVMILYGFMLAEEKGNLEKFGDAYARYMQSVPRLNLLAGCIRLRGRRRRAL